uniref:Putative non-histone protein 10 n=2 Tax=Nyssomyia neivai TaxID=330878 RepID=A0A1L8DWF4_9DIPT
MYFLDMPTEFSDNSPAAFELSLDEKYRDCSRMFQKMCRELQKENERIISRLYRMKKMTKVCEKDVKLLQTRLDRHNPAWRLEPPPPPLFPQTDLHPVKKRRKSAFTAKTEFPKGVRKQKEKDPNAPKKPPNAFFQYCQEQRSILLDEIASERQPGEPEPSKQELTRQLAQRWRSMGNDDKQVYVDMYENSKRKYNQDMMYYRMDTHGENSSYAGGK